MIDVLYIVYMADTVCMVDMVGPVPTVTCNAGS